MNRPRPGARPGAGVSTGPRRHIDPSYLACLRDLPIEDLVEYCESILEEYDMALGWAPDPGTWTTC